MLMYQWVLIPLDSLLNVRLSQQWWKTRLEPKRMRDWVFDMNERKWAGFLKYNVLFRALVPEIWFGKGVPNQFEGFKFFRNVEPELYFCKGKKGNPGGKKNHGGGMRKFPIQTLEAHKALSREWPTQQKLVADNLKVR
jgi:hypothetical protein